MRTSILKLFAPLAALLLPFPLLAERVTAECPSGVPGEVVTVTVSLESSVPLSGLQVSMPLGEAAEVVAGAASALGRAEGHSATAGSKTDGTATLMLYSPSMGTIPAGSGEVASFSLRLADSPATLSVPISVKATDAEGNAVPCEGATFTLTVAAPMAEYPSGAAYDFGRVPLFGDYTLTIPVRNSGTTPLIVSGASFSAPELSCATELPLTVPAGSTSDLMVTYHPVERGAASATVTIECNSAGSDNTLRILSVPFAVNELHVGDASGISDSEVTIPLMVNNMDPITGFTFEFELPRQLEYVDGSFQLADRAAGHTLSASLKGNKLHATAYSLTDTPFEGNDGVVATFRVRLSGRYNAMVAASKAVLSATVKGEVTDVTSATYPGNVSISYPSISVANAVSLGRTPITETATTRLNVSNHGSAPLIIDRLAHDGIDLAIAEELPLTIAPGQLCEINLSHEGLAEGQLSTTMQLYCNDPDQRMVPIALSGERYAPNELVMTSKQENEENCALYIALDNYDAISAVQFDLEYPNSFIPGVPQGIKRAEGFSITTREVASHTLRVFCYFLDGSEIISGKGEIISIPFSFSPSIAETAYGFSVWNVKLSDASMRDRHSGLGDYFAELNVSHNPSTSIEKSVTDLHGINVSGRVLTIISSEAVIYDSYGRLMCRPVPGDALSLSPGLYLVTTPTASSKLLIR